MWWKTHCLICLVQSDLCMQAACICFHGTKVCISLCRGREDTNRLHESEGNKYSPFRRTSPTLLHPYLHLCMHTTWLYLCVLYSTRTPGLFLYNFLNVLWCLLCFPASTWHFTMLPLKQTICHYFFSQLARYVTHLIDNIILIVWVSRA